MRLPRLCVLGAVVWTTAAPVWAADSFAAGVLTCAAEADRDRRLDCYDRAVANYTAGLTAGKRNPSAGAAPVADTGAGATTAPASRGSGASRPSGPSAPAEPTPPPPARPGRLDTSDPAAAGSNAAPVDAAAKPAPSNRHFFGRIVSVDYFPDYVVVHLDNEQVWKQVSESPGAAALHTGDPVTIDKSFGSYWLAGPKGEAVQVQLETPKH